MSHHQDETIQILNSLVRVRVAPSKIHGVGLVTIRPLNKGMVMNLMMFPQAFKIPYGSWSKLWNEVGNLLLERWPRITEGSAFMYPDTLLQAYINHSEDPNYDPISDTLIKDVAEGEEITQNYRLIPNHEEVYPWLKKKKATSKSKNVV